MIKRKIENEITKWYESSKTALLVNGARQTGKTTSIRMFLEEITKTNCVELNLIDNKLALEAFNTSLDSNQLIIRLTALSEKS